MTKILCAYCGKDIVETKYWRDKKFHEGQKHNYFYCGPDCSTEHHEEILKKDKK